MKPSSELKQDNQHAKHPHCEEKVEFWLLNETSLRMRRQSTIQPISPVVSVGEAQDHIPSSGEIEIGW